MMIDQITEKFRQDTKNGGYLTIATDSSVAEYLRGIARAAEKEVKAGAKKPARRKRKTMRRGVGSY